MELPKEEPPKPQAQAQPQPPPAGDQTQQPAHEAQSSMEVD